MMKQLQVEFNSDVELKGTLALPSTGGEKFSAILILPGSGSINRDGNAVKGKFQFNVYKELAEYFTSLGFATLRYDKRGVGESGGDPLRAGLWDAAADAEAAVNFLASHPHVDPDRIIVAGHSEGCIVGTALNEKRAVNGLIFLSGGGGGIREQLEFQREQLYKEMKEAKGLKGFVFRTLRVPEKNEKKAQKLFGKMASTKKEVIKAAVFVKMPAKYFREHFEYNIAEGLKKITCPVLALNGSKDFQANPELLQRITYYAKGKTTCLVVENMDHGLKEQLNSISVLNFKKDYLQSIGKPIHPKAKDHMAQWLKEWTEGEITA
ncbi:alpha/beta hydrolase [Siminovitchia sediminis]|uniref:Alpha/beta hydrolase n=1 Tax=Siminovitchia sediminis TaxID=1274353 RepID=A0ABW4KEJ3_9BACI